MMGNESKYLLQKRISDLNKRVGEDSTTIVELQRRVNELALKVKELEPKTKVEYIVKVDDTSLQLLIDEIKEVLESMSPDMQKQYISQLMKTVIVTAEIAKGNFNPFKGFKA